MKRIGKLIKDFAKKHWYKVLSLLCAVLMVAMSVCVAYAESGSSGGGSGLIRGSQPISVWDACNYMCLVTGESLFNIWSQYDIYNYSSSYGVKFVSRRKHHEWGMHTWYVWRDENGDIQSDLRLTIEDSGGFEGDASAPTISAAEFKDAVSDYNNRYAPMPTQSMWKWSYQTDLGYKPAKKSMPYIPIMWSNYGSWGGKDGSWKECYVLPFVTDDDVPAPYYCNYYYHFFPTVEEVDGVKTPYINIEVYKLIDNELYTDGPWVYSLKTGQFEGYTGVLALNLLGYRDIPCLYGYKSDAGYLTNQSRDTYGGVNLSPHSSGYAFSGGSLSSLTLNKYLCYLITETTFTPDTNIGDDWGAYISKTPFELYANQKTVDFDRLPDNYYITINGDTFYDYSITNPDTDDTTSIGDFIIDYDFPDLGDIEDPGDDSGSGSGGGSSVSGDVNVGGKVDVSGDVKVGGEIVIKADPVDINVNVNNNTSGGAGDSLGDYVNSTSEIEAGNYIGMIPEVSKGFFDYLSDFMAWLPAEIKGLVILGLIVAIWCRLHGR